MTRRATRQLTDADNEGTDQGLNLDTFETANMTGPEIKTFERVAFWHCLHCGHSWQGRARKDSGRTADERPRKCAGCQSAYWDRPRVRNLKQKKKKA